MIFKIASVDSLVIYFGNEISEENEKNRAAILYGIKESATNSQGNISSTVAQTVSLAKSELGEKIDGSIEKIVEKQGENSEILTGISQTQQSNKNLLAHVWVPLTGRRGRR